MNALAFVLEGELGPAVRPWLIFAESGFSLGHPLTSDGRPPNHRQGDQRWHRGVEEESFVRLSYVLASQRIAIFHSFRDGAMDKKGGTSGLNPRSLRARAFVKAAKSSADRYRLFLSTLRVVLAIFAVIVASVAFPIMDCRRCGGQVLSFLPIDPTV
jgi:hypothetical protein